MKIKFAILAMTGLALTAGCNRGSTNSSANSSATNNSAAAAPAAAPAPAAGGSPVTQASLVGTWGQDNCTNSMTFAADGTATSTGATSDNVRWTLDGSTIVITAPGQPETRIPATINGDTLRLSNPGGQSADMTRCPAPAGGAAAQSEAKEEAAEAAE